RAPAFPRASPSTPLPVSAARSFARPSVRPTHPSPQMPPASRALAEAGTAPCSTWQERCQFFGGALSPLPLALDSPRGDGFSSSPGRKWTAECLKLGGNVAPEPARPAGKVIVENKTE